MSQIIIASSKALSRDIDVRVNVSKPQVELTTDLSVVVFLTPNDITFDQSANRIRYYDSLDAVAADFVTSSEAYRAATAFFSQSPRAQTFAVARVFEDPVAGFLKTGSLSTTMATWTAITTGSFAIALDGVTKKITGLDFSACTTLTQVAAVINTALDTSVDGTTCVLENGALKITSATTGNASSVGFLTTAYDTATPPAVIGVDISGHSYLKGAYLIDSAVQDAYAVPGYAPTDLVTEAGYIKEAAACAGKFVYGWTLDKQYRDDSDAVDLAEWIEAQTAILGLCVNSSMAYDANSTTDVGALVNAAGYTRTFAVYHNNAYYYPEVAVLAYALSVDYAMENSTITVKFKDLLGIPTVPIDAADNTVLESKRINTFTLVGNNSRTVREGTEAHDSWFLDDRINLDNFKEELQVAVYNVFLLKKKVPYTSNGVNMLWQAIDAVCSRYVLNGTFSERPSTTPSGDKPAIEPAYSINFTSLSRMSASDRASRKGPPCTLVVNLAGAIHSINIDVTAFA
jgi:hypothetical protein